MIILTTVLFSGSMMTVHAEESGAKIRMDETTEATTEAATNGNWTVTTFTSTATPGDAWYSNLPGTPDAEPKTLDDIYLILYWILIIVATYALFRAVIFIYNCLT